MKLIIQISCYNEEDVLRTTLNALPKHIEGIDKIETLIINDGSVDNTLKVAQDFGVHYIISFKKNQGLARSFMAGINACLRNGADIIVNTDADNQYQAKDIEKLVRPIIEGKADMVIGTRPISRIEDFSFFKKRMQKIGSWLVRKVSRTNVQDAPSGFRAFSKNCALKLNVFNTFTYTHETIIQAGLKNMALVCVPIEVNPTTRPSRLFRSIPTYMVRSFMAILRMVVVYRPFRFFLTLGVLFLSGGLVMGFRYLYFWLHGEGARHIQSVILMGVFFGISFQMILVAFVADLLGVNRKLLEEIQYRLRKQEINHSTDGSLSLEQEHDHKVENNWQLFSDF